MMVMTAKVDLKKILAALAAAAAVVLALVMLLGGGDQETAATAAPAAGSNDARVEFLKSFGWDVTTSPTESSQVKIPTDPDPVFQRYNALQKGQGYDLSQFAGKKAMRYVYKVGNYPGATEPVYATVLVYKGEIIGGDITNTAPGGKIQGFQRTQGAPMPSTAATTPTADTATPPATTAQT